MFKFNIWKKNTSPSSNQLNIVPICNIEQKYCKFSYQLNTIRWTPFFSYLFDLVIYPPNCSAYLFQIIQIKLCPFELTKHIFYILCILFHQLQLHIYISKKSSNTHTEKLLLPKCNLYFHDVEWLWW